MTLGGTWLDFMDFISEGVAMPLGALVMSILVGWVIGPKVIRNEVSLEGNTMGTVCIPSSASVSALWPLWLWPSSCMARSPPLFLPHDFSQIKIGVLYPDWVQDAFLSVQENE